MGNNIINMIKIGSEQSDGEIVVLKVVLNSSTSENFGARHEG